MNRRFFVLWTAALLPFAGCQKTSNTDTTDSDQEGTPPPAPLASEVAAARPEPNTLAPPGVFFLIAATSVQTDDGIVGLPPGTRVLRQADGTYVAGEHRLPLRADQITNDLRVARRIAEADAAAQDTIRRTSQAAATAAAQRVPSMTPKPARAAPSHGTPLPPVRSASTPSGTSLGQAGGLGRAHSSNKDKVYLDAAGRKYWKDARGRLHYDF